MNAKRKVNLQLVALDGNAFALLGAFQRQARAEGWEPAEIKAVIDEATSGDYDHLLATLIENTQADQGNTRPDDGMNGHANGRGRT